MAFPETWLGDFRASELITGWFPIYRYDLFHDLFAMISSIARSDQIYLSIYIYIGKTLNIVEISVKMVKTYVLTLAECHLHINNI